MMNVSVMYSICVCGAMSPYPIDVIVITAQ